MELKLHAVYTFNSRSTIHFITGGFVHGMMSCHILHPNGEDLSIYTLFYARANRLATAIANCSVISVTLHIAGYYIVTDSECMMNFSPLFSTLAGMHMWPSYICTV